MMDLVNLVKEKTSILVPMAKIAMRFKPNQMGILVVLNPD
jgi:hypothetical protein